MAVRDLMVMNDTFRRVSTIHKPCGSFAYCLTRRNTETRSRVPKRSGYESPQARSGKPGNRGNRGQTGRFLIFSVGDGLSGSRDCDGHFPITLPGAGMPGNSSSLPAPTGSGATSASEISSSTFCNKSQADALRSHDLWFVSNYKLLVTNVGID
jgi:hypothetical protein